MFSLISEHLLEQNIISDNQWGFTSNKSTTTALLALTHDWFKHLEVGIEVCVVFLDLQTASDSVLHRNLLLGVKNFGLHPHPTQVDLQLSDSQITGGGGGRCRIF